MLFSQRMGLKPVKALIQTDSMDSDLRNALWNVMQTFLWDEHRDEGHYGYTEDSTVRWLLKLYWHGYFKWPLDQMPERFSGCVKVVRDYFYSSSWNEVYDFIEFTALQLRDAWQAKFIESCNSMLEREVSGFRFIGSVVTPISSDQEVDSIESALSNTSALSGANAHLRSALEKLSDRRSPDYRNSIKESISAVESLAQVVTNNTSATLGAALKVIESRGGMHPALKTSLNALYGYTSDSEGIRHAMLDESNLTFSDAKFMLVACSAFVNYLVAKAHERGLIVS